MGSGSLLRRNHGNHVADTLIGGGDSRAAWQDSLATEPEAGATRTHILDHY